jgi:hypothetical protein
MSLFNIFASKGEFVVFRDGRAALVKPTQEPEGCSTNWRIPAGYEGFSRYSGGVSRPVGNKSLSLRVPYYGVICGGGISAFTRVFDALCDRSIDAHFSP